MISEHKQAELKEALEKEQALLMKELGGLGKQNPDNPSDWVAAKPDTEQFGADRNDNADIFEDMQDANATINELEGRLNTVNAALKKMEDGTYGVCEVSGEDIEMDRLEANPAAATCKKHMDVAS